MTHVFKSQDINRDIKEGANATLIWERYATQRTRSPFSYNVEGLDHDQVEAIIKARGEA